MLLEKYGPNRVKFFEGDLCDAPFITRIFEREGVEWVVHMAARAGVRPSIEDPFVYVHSNVEATTRLLELSRLHGVKSFVFASSSSVYGGSQNEVSTDKIRTGWSNRVDTRESTCDRQQARGGLGGVRRLRAEGKTLRTCAP